MSEIKEEELITKHKKERKDLQAQIQSLKKSCVKGDKKKKKEVTEQILRLEQELDDKQNKELNEMKGDTPTTEEKPEDISEEVEMTENIDDVSPKEIRVSKAQKRRNKKAAEDRKREERIRLQEEENKKGPRLIETEKINNILKEYSLKIYPIAADGNCLYCSINHQLKITGRTEYSVAELRQLTAKYMREHKDDILPFMSNDFDEIYTADQYEKYCNKVARTTEWGGQIEILALSNALKCPIKIIQANALPTVQGEDFNGPPLVLTYHRHLYRLGEHYNSTVPI